MNLRELNGLVEVGGSGQDRKSRRNLELVYHLSHDETRMPLDLTLNTDRYLSDARTALGNTRTVGGAGDILRYSLS